MRKLLSLIALSVASVSVAHADQLVFSAEKAGGARVAALDYVSNGDAVAFDATRGLMEVAVKNRFALGDTVECLHPAGNHVQRIGRMENAAGEAVAIAPGSGHRVWIDLPALYTKSFVARFF